MIKLLSHAADSMPELAAVKTFAGKTAVAILLLAPGSLAMAADYPKIIQSIIDKGVKVEKSFPAASNMKGWVVSQNGKYMIVYTTPDDKTLLSGMLIDENGENLTAVHSDKHIPRPDYGALYKDLGKASFAVEGKSKNPKSTLYVFFDPNCPYCQMAWKALQPYEKVGLQVRWLPVAYLRPSSQTKAAAILEASDKGAAFRDTMQNLGHGKETPAAGAASIKPKTAAKIQKNSELMRKFGMTGTPGIIWKDKDGKVTAKAGMPRLSEIPVMTGLPEQKMTDPALARFQ